MPRDFSAVSRTTENIPKPIAGCEVLTAVKTKGLFQLIKKAFRAEPPLHPIEQKMAKRWIKQRLVAVFPELRKDPVALERAYQSLSLDARPGTDEGDGETVFEMSAPWIS